MKRQQEGKVSEMMSMWDSRGETVGVRQLGWDSLGGTVGVGQSG